MTRSHRKISTVILSCLVLFGLRAVAPAQEHGHDGDRTRGRITAITGNSIDVEQRDGGTTTIVTTGNTTFVRNGQPATLESFAVGDFVVARGQQNGNGAFVAEAVRGGERPPHPPAHDRVRGQVVSVDAAGGSITVSTAEGATEVIYVTADTQIVRDRQQATLADFAPGDRLRAAGERDPDDRLIADRILGASGSGQ
jgi:hypothetical protein